MLKELKKALQKMGRETVEGARLNLSKDKSKSSGALKKSLYSEVVQSGDEVQLQFWMEEYGMFLDAGVYGADPSIVKKGKQKGKETDSVFTGNNGIAERFSYKSKGGKFGLKGMPPPAAFDSWTKVNNLSLKSKNGKVMTRQTLNFLIARGVFAQGIAPTLFFTTPFIKAFNNLPDKIVNAFDIYVNTVLEEDRNATKN